MKKVQLDIGINTSGIKDATRTANASYKSMTDAARKYFSEKQSLLDKEVEANKLAMDKIKSNRKRTEQQILQDEKQSLQTRQRQLNQELSNANKQSNSNKRSGANFLKGAGMAELAMGNRTSGYMMRMAGQTGIGAELIGSLGTGGMVALGAGLAGIAVASKLVEVGFEVLSSVVKSTAGAFLGAMTTLGGARSLQESIEAGARRESLISSARMSVGSNERLSVQEITNKANSLSTTKNLGGASAEEWIKAIGVYGKYSAKQRSLTSDDTDFIGKVSLLSRDQEGKPDLQGTAHMYGMLQSQGNTSEEAKQIILKNIAIGQNSTMSPSDLLKSAGSMELTSLLGGNKVQNYGEIAGIMSNINSYTGDVSQSETQTKSIIMGLKKAHLAGHDIGEFDSEGKIVDLNASLAKLASMTDVQRSSAGFSKRAEAGLGIASLEEVAKGKGQSLEDLLNTTQNVNMSMDELNTTSSETIGIVESLQVSFNKITNTLAESTKPTLTELSNAFQDFADDFPNWKEDISGAVSGIVKGLTDVSIIGTSLAEDFTKILSPLASFAQFMKKIPGEILLNLIPGGTVYSNLWTGFKGVIGEKGRDALNDLEDKITPNSDDLDDFGENLKKANEHLVNFGNNLGNIRDRNSAPSQPDTSGGVSIERL